jgi:hypothetical protein
MLLRRTRISHYAVYMVVRSVLSGLVTCIDIAIMIDPAPQQVAGCTCGNHESNELDRSASQCFVRSILPPLLNTAMHSAKNEHAMLNTVNLLARYFVLDKRWLTIDRMECRHISRDQEISNSFASSLNIFDVRKRFLHDLESMSASHFG